MVNAPLRLPLAIYGKPGVTADAGGYRFLVRHRDFDPAPLDRALRRLVGALEWKPAVQRHPTVFGLLAEGGTTLVARFLDAGRDANGRPHALRVECILWRRGSPPATLLTDSTWAERTESPCPELVVNGISADGKALPSPRPPGSVLLLGKAAHFFHGPSSTVGEIDAPSVDGSSASADT